MTHHRNLSDIYEGFHDMHVSLRLVPRVSLPLTRVCSSTSTERGLHPLRRRHVEVDVAKRVSVALVGRFRRNMYDNACIHVDTADTMEMQRTADRATSEAPEST